MTLKFTNNASADLTGPIISSDTQLTVQSGTGDRFPSLSTGEYFFATLIDQTGVLEIVKVTARSGDTLTIVRGQDGTTARAYFAGDRVELRIVAAGLSEFGQLTASQTFTGVNTFTQAVVGSISGNAGTATVLQTARLIGGVSFNGSANINLPGVNTAGNQNTTGTAANVTGTVAITNGGTGATTAAAALTNLGAAPTASPVFTGASTFANGTASAPGIRFTTETNTGFYRSGTNEISVTTNGTLAATFAANGNFTATGTVTGNSDERLKKDWSSLPDDFVEQLALVKHGTYTRIDSGVRQIGVSAQSLQPLAPEGVLGNDILSVAYGNVALVAAIQLAKRVLELEQKLANTSENTAKARDQ
jgi:hypothetical protein